MNCLKSAPYKRFDRYKCSFVRSTNFYLILFMWIVGMLLIFSLAVLLMILSVSSFASELPKPKKINSTFNIFSKSIPMFPAHPDARPLKSSNHKLMSTPSVYTPSSPHETFGVLERLGAQPNYYNPRYMKGNLLLPQWRLALMPDNSFQRLPTDRSLLSSQIPRPPRLTRTLSENRRRYIETASEQPRPFNFPLEGPQPSEFKNAKASKKENLPMQGNSKKVNNIQDILRQEQVPNTNQYRMPIGIHISGSFKNLQNSGISNVFRKYVQLQPQISPSQFNYQRLAFDPFFPYKPKSLNDINSLAMKQLGLNRSKKKNKNKIIPGMIFQQSGQRPVSTDYFLDALKLNHSLNGLAGQQNMKNEPFSVKLEVFPIRSGKKVPVLPLPETQFLTTIRPNPQNFEPFYPQIGFPYGMPMDASYLTYANNLQQQKKSRYPQVYSSHSSTYQRDKLPLESDEVKVAAHSKDVKKPAGKKPQANSNQLMVHLNVFPSKKENAVQQNHLYDIIHADVHERSLSDIATPKNETSKSTYLDCETDDSFDSYDNQHHLISKDVLTIEKADTTEFDSSPINREAVSTSKNKTENNGEKLSTFRFPVENLMQFQANDAVI